MLFIRLFDLCLFGFVCFVFLFLSGVCWACDFGTPWTFLSHFYRAKVRLQQLPVSGKKKDFCLFSVFNYMSGKAHLNLSPPSF